MNLLTITIVLAGIVSACSKSATPAPTPASPTPTAPSPVAVVVPAPPPAISGQVISNVDGAPVRGAVVAPDGLAPVTTDGSGGYSIEWPDAAARRTVVAATGFLYRETYVGGGNRTGVNLELIPADGSVLPNLYRQMARNGFERPTDLQPIRRWTVNPNFYIETTWRDSSAEVRPDGVAFFMAEIRRVVPQLTGGRLEAGLIESGPNVRPFNPGWVYIHFNRSGNWGRLGENPGEVQFGTDSPCTSAMVIHEIGHAMGYWHNGLRPSAMGGGYIGSCEPSNFTPEEQLVARVMYGRAPGNTEPDKDPGTFAGYATTAGVVVP